MATKPDPVTVLQQSCKDIQLKLRTEALVKKIREFDGEGGKKFKEWLKEVEPGGVS